jgi:hypothetical protein
VWRCLGRRCWSCGSGSASGCWRSCPLRRGRLWRYRPLRRGLPGRTGQVIGRAGERRHDQGLLEHSPRTGRTHGLVTRRDRLMHTVTVPRIDLSVKWPTRQWRLDHLPRRIRVLPPLAGEGHLGTQGPDPDATSQVLLEPPVDIRGAGLPARPVRNGAALPDQGGRLQHRVTDLFPHRPA